MAAGRLRIKSEEKKQNLLIYFARRGSNVTVDWATNIVRTFNQALTGHVRGINSVTAFGTPPATKETGSWSVGVA